MVSVVRLVVLLVRGNNEASWPYDSEGNGDGVECSPSSEGSRGLIESEYWDNDKDKPNTCLALDAQAREHTGKVTMQTLLEKWCGIFATASTTLTTTPTSTLTTTTATTTESGKYARLFITTSSLQYISNNIKAF